MTLMNLLVRSNNFSTRNKNIFISCQRNDQNLKPLTIHRRKNVYPEDLFKVWGQKAITRGEVRVVG